MVRDLDDDHAHTGHKILHRHSQSLPDSREGPGDPGRGDHQSVPNGSEKHLISVI